MAPSAFMIRLGDTIVNLNHVAAIVPDRESKYMCRVILSSGKEVSICGNGIDDVSAAIKDAKGR